MRVSLAGCFRPTFVALGDACLPCRPGPPTSADAPQVLICTLRGTRAPLLLSASCLKVVHSSASLVRLTRCTSSMARVQHGDNTDASALKNVERLILSQAVYEHGSEAWPKVSIIMTEHPMLSRPKSFFTAQVSLHPLCPSRTCVETCAYSRHVPKYIYSY